MARKYRDVVNNPLTTDKVEVPKQKDEGNWRMKTDRFKNPSNTQAKFFKKQRERKDK